VGISILQLLWDRGEPSAYLPHLTDDPLPNTPPHQVMIHEAFGDHQVANIQTETMARSIDAAVRTPEAADQDPVDPLRLEDRPDTDPGTAGDQPYHFSDTINPFFLPTQPQIDPDDLNVMPGYTGAPATLFTFDTGEIRDDPGPGTEWIGSNANPDWNIAPVGRSGMNPNDGLDPHEPAATSPKAQQIAIPFLLGQGAFDSCVSGAPGPLDMPPWTPPYMGVAEFCTAPPVHSPGQGQ
jgi:hypothetical protein